MESKECDAMSLSLQKPIQTNFDSDKVHGVAWSYLGLEYTAQQHTRVGWRRSKVEQPADLLHPSLYTQQDNQDKEYSPASRSVFKLISCECFLTKNVGSLEYTAHDRMRCPGHCQRQQCQL